MYRDDKKRARLIGLTSSVPSRKSSYGDTHESLTLRNLYQNLPREWSDI